MSLSVGALNGGLNLLLLLLHLALALLAERTYSLAARAQLHLTRATAATDVSQLHMSHWGSAGIKWLRQRLREGTGGGCGEGKVGREGGGADNDCDDAVSVAGSDGRGGHGTGGGGGSGDHGTRANWDMPGGGDGTTAESDSSHRPRRDGDTADDSGSWHVRHGGSWSWAWVVALAAGLIALFPAELILETGLDARRDCAPKRVVVTDGVCASPSRNVPDAAASVAAVLSAHLNWVDKTWTVVPEGASKSMATAEVRASTAAVDRVVVTNCALTTTPCTDVPGGCGNVVVQNTGGARGFVTIDSSLRQQLPSSSPAAAPPGRGSMTQRARLPQTLRMGPPAEAVTGPANSTTAAATVMGGHDGADRPTSASGGAPTTSGNSPSGAPSTSGRPSGGTATNSGGPSSGSASGGNRLPPNSTLLHGDLVFTSSYLFWPDTLSASDTAAAAAAVTARGGRSRTRIATRGVEVVLTLADFGRVMGAVRRQSTAPLTFPVRSDYGRVYNISCDTDGLHGGDLAAAASTFRTMQMSHPIGQSGGFGAIPTERVLPPPLTVDAVVRGAFAWKAVDSYSSCSAPVPMYTDCGTMDWLRAVPLVAVVATLLGLYGAAMAMAWNVPRELYVPTNAAAWQRLAMAAGRAGNGGGGGGGGGAVGGDGRGDGGDTSGDCPHCLAGGAEVGSLSTVTLTTGGGGGGGSIGSGGTTVVPPPGAPASPRAGALPASPRGDRLLLPLPGSPVAHQTPYGSVYVVLGDA